MAITALMFDAVRHAKRTAACQLFLLPGVVPNAWKRLAPKTTTWLEFLQVLLPDGVQGMIQLVDTKGMGM